MGRAALQGSRSLAADGTTATGTRVITAMGETAHLEGRRETK